MGEQCYLLLALPDNSTWVEAQTACGRQGAVLAPLPTPAHWRRLPRELARWPGRRPTANVYVGLRSGDPSLPFR